MKICFLMSTDSPTDFAGLSLNIISSSRSVNPRLFISAANAPAQSHAHQVCRKSNKECPTIPCEMHLGFSSML